jgi:hypothetical protein
LYFAENFLKLNANLSRKFSHSEHGGTEWKEGGLYWRRCSRRVRTAAQRHSEGERGNYSPLTTDGYKGGVVTKTIFFICVNLS